MKKTLLILILLSVSIISGCNLEYESFSEDENNAYESFSEDENNDLEETINKISINGINKIREISSKIPVELDINGVGHQITIKKGTIVKSIDVNGKDIIINLPEDSSPEIKDNGINVQIKYY